VVMFTSLKALPAYNEIIFAACNLAIMRGVSFHAYHIPGLENSVADALSRGRPDSARELAPGLQIAQFTPPVVS
ncbi:hypothetical protein AURDEDRAFT_38693, partial [Auricularia subglabra TFB-10046 SS5]